MCAALTKAKSHTDKVYIFDAEHEKRRKEQLKKLFERTPEQVEEEQMLLAELRKIEQRKKERDRKTQDLQKLITAADHQADPRKNERKPTKKSGASARNRPNKTDASHVNNFDVITIHLENLPYLRTSKKFSDSGIGRNKVPRFQKQRRVAPFAENKAAE